MTPEDIKTMREHADKFADDVCHSDIERTCENMVRVSDERFARLVEGRTRVSMTQLFLDPENQPTQYGTVTAEYHDKEMARERRECAAHFLSLHRDATKQKDSEIAALRAQVEVLMNTMSGFAALQANPPMKMLAHAESVELGKTMEREECAKLCDVLAEDYGKAGLPMAHHGLAATAKEIRKRGQP